MDLENLVKIKRIPHWEEYGIRRTGQFGLDKVLSKPYEGTLWAKLRYWEALMSAKMPADKIRAVGGRPAVWEALVLAEFALQGAPIYKIGRTFGEVFLRTNGRVATKFLPFNNKIICIEFPESIDFDFKDGDRARCVYIGASSENVDPTYRYDEGTRPVQKEIRMLVPLYRDGVMVGRDEYAMLMSGEEENLDDVILEGIRRITPIGSEFRLPGAVTGFSAEFIRYVLGLFLYIHSGAPDMREFRPSPRPTSAKNSKQRKWLLNNEAGIPMTLVGFDYKKDRVYSVSSTTVEGHPRWQPYGPQNSLVKWIWIDEHERHFKQPSVE